MTDSIAIMSETKHDIVVNKEVSLLCPTCSGDRVSDFLEAPDRFHLRKERYRLSRCSSCRSVWLNDPPRREDMRYHYSDDYHKGIVAAGEGSALSRWKGQVELIARHKQEGSILDIGCSSGGFLSTMKGPSWKLYGIEMEESTAERARANTGAEVFVGDAVAAPFPPAAFDVITAFDVLEHVYSPREFLTKVLEWLKPGGVFYAMMPNIASWEARFFATYWYGLELPRHLTHFSPHSLKHLMSSIGFEEVLMKTPSISYVERSVGYVSSAILENLGFSPAPQSRPKPLSLPRKAIRKGMRLVVIAPLAKVASIAGAGPSLEAIFRKPESVSAKSSLEKY